MFALKKAGHKWWLMSLAVTFFSAAQLATAGLEPELPGIVVLKQRVGNGLAFSLRNPQLAELTVSLNFSVLNLASNVRLPLEVVVPPLFTTRPLVVLLPV